MSGINVQISTTNLTQLDRHQNDQHRLPIVNQVQNAAAAQEMTQKRLAMPVEPDGVANKTIDSEDRKKTADRRGRKRKKREQPEKKSTGTEHSRSSDHFIDFQV